MNVIGSINPCHRPAQNPAGSAPGCLYFEFDPAIASTFAIILFSYFQFCQQVIELFLYYPESETLSQDPLRDCLKRKPGGGFAQDAKGLSSISYRLTPLAWARQRPVPNLVMFILFLTHCIFADPTLAFGQLRIPDQKHSHH